MCCAHVNNKICCWYFLFLVVAINQSEKYICKKNKQGDVRDLLTWQKGVFGRSSRLIVRVNMRDWWHKMLGTRVQVNLAAACHGVHYLVIRMVSEDEHARMRSSL